jgi:hypothetical protein
MPVVMTSLKLPPALHYHIAVAATSRQISAHTWMLNALEDAVQRESRTNQILAAALKTKTAPRTKPQQQQQAQPE